MMHIGKSVRIALVKQGLTVKDLAERMKVGVDRVYQLRRTRISASCDAIEKLAKAFDMPVSEFIALGE